MKVENKVFIVDASFMLAIFLHENIEGEYLDTFNNFVLGKVEFIAPELLRLEVANGLLSAYKRKRLNPELMHSLFDSFMKLDIRYIHYDIDPILMFAYNKGLSVYDAVYGYLSKELNISLLTLDTDLQKL